MEPPLMMDLRVSKVAPMVEGNLVELVDMVKQMGRKDHLTESQNRKMVGYLGNLDEMRSQIVIMVQRYEDDSKVLKRLLELLDRIDDVRDLAIKSEYSQPLDSPAVESDMEITIKYDTPFNPLMVSTLNILDVSGLFADNIREEDLIEEVEEGDGDEYWDHEIDHSALAPANDAPQEISEINLSVSSMHLPDLFDSGSHITPQSAPSSPLSGPSQDKGKGKSQLSQSFSAIEAEITNGKSKGKGKGKEKARDKGKGRVKFGYAVQPSRKEKVAYSDSSSDDEDAPNGASSSWKSAHPGSSSSSSRRPTTSTVDSDSASETDSGSESESETELSRKSSETSSESSSGSESESPRSRVPPAPPLPSGSKKHRRKKGPCDPVLCKICYDEYTMHEEVYEFSECKHAYCNECLNDYLVTHINEGAVLDLVCPFPDCTTEVLPTDIKALCNSETIAKFERFTVLAALRADPNARWCPNPYCNNGIKHDPATMPWVYCSACKFEFCFHCMAERHDGFPCGEQALAFLKKKKESEELAIKEFETFAEAMHAYVKPCPGCKAFIEKNDGCNHMTCGNPTCRTQFCWLCLNIYSADHFMDDTNFPDCYDKQYYTPYDLPPRPTYVQPRIRRRRFANVAKKVGIYVGVGVAVVTLGVPAAVIGGPVYGAFQLHKRLKAKRREAAARSVINYHDESYNYNNANWVPPSPERIAEAAREARRLYDLEHS